MKNKLKFLTKVSLMRKIKTKWFVVANILLCLALIGIMNIDSIINFFGGDFDDKTTIYVLDNTEYTYDMLKEQIQIVDESYYGEDSDKYKVEKYDKSEEELKEELSDDKKAIGFVISESDKSVLDVTAISEGYIDSVDYQLLTTAINNSKMAIAISLSNIEVEELNKIYDPVEINRIILDEEKKTDEENTGMIMTTVFPIIILPFFMLTIFLVQMIGAEVNDEKTTRGMEIIISNVSPKTHFLSKILAGNIFVILQGALLLLYGGVALLIKSMLDKTGNVGNIIGIIKDAAGDILTPTFVSQLAYIIPLTLVLMLLSFLAYSLLAGILSSVTTNTEDFQQIQTPIMIVLMVGYYLAIMASSFDGALFIRAISYVPLISAILSPSLLVIGQIGIIDVLISIGLMVLTNFLLFKYGLRVYKVGILNYSSEGLWKKMFSALKK